MTYTHPQYEAKVRRWKSGIDGDVEKALRKGGEIVVAEVIQNHLSGPKMDRGSRSEKDSTLQPQSGRLKNSVHATVRTVSAQIRLFVGTNVIYAGAHEYGYPPNNIPERSFLRSSRDKKLDAVKKAISKEMVASYHRS